jgi:hypothetical protein
MKFPRFVSSSGVWYTIIVVFVVLFVILPLVLTYSNHTVKKITIKEKTMYAPGKYRKNMIIDENGNAYTVTNDALMMHYTSIELYGSMEVGKTYIVSAYGIRQPFLGLFPNIVKATRA